MKQGTCSKMQIWEDEEEELPLMDEPEEQEPKRR